MLTTEVRETMATAIDIVDMEFDPVSWIINDVFRSGLNIMIAPERSGKSYLSICFALALTTGLTWEKTSSNTCGDVLFLSYESDQRDMKKRLGQYLNEETPNDRLRFHFNWPKLEESGLQQLKEWKEECPNLKLIVIDTLVDFVGNRFDGKYASQSRLLGEMRSFAKENDLAILALHHPPKGDKKDSADVYYGSRALGGKADIILMLSTNDIKKEGTLRVKGNGIQSRIFHVAWNDQGPWHITHEEDTRLLNIRITPEKLEMLKVISENEGIKTCAIPSLLSRDVSESTVRSSVRSLVQDDCITNTSHGHYAITSFGNELLKRYSESTHREESSDNITEDEVSSVHENIVASENSIDSADTCDDSLDLLL